MAGNSEDGQRRHRRGVADLPDAEPPEEGELVPDRADSDMNTDDYYNNNNYYSSSHDTDETTSDCNYAACSVAPSSSAAATGPSFSSAVATANNNCNAASSSPVVAAPAPALLACPICGKEFRSRKAVCGHMKVHQQGPIGRRHEQQQGIKRSNAAVAGGWGGTGKRGGSGCWSKPASPNARSSDQSMAIVVANPNIVLQPTPLAFAAPNPLPPVRRMESATPNLSSVSMASGTPNPSSVPIAASTMTNVSDESSSEKPMNSDAMETETVVAGAANPPTEAFVHAPPPPAEALGGVANTQSVHQQPIAPPPPPGAEEERVHLPPAVHHPHHIAPPAAALAGRQNPNGYTCRQCGVWFPTHQGLGGHMAGHKTRELAAVPCRRDAKPEKVHACKVCDAVFPTGVQLGGHMRKHYNGAPIVPKKKPRLVDVVVQPLPPPAEQRALEPAPRPAVPGRVRLFGVDIDTGAGAQTPATQAQEEGSSAATQAPSASTGAEQ